MIRLDRTSWDNEIDNLSLLLREICNLKSLPFPETELGQIYADFQVIVGDSLSNLAASREELLSSSETDLRSRQSKALQFSLLQSLAQRVGLRIRQMNTRFRELLMATTEICPVLVRVSENAAISESFFLIRKRTGVNRFSILIGEQERTVSRNWIKRNADTDEVGSLTWYMVGQVNSSYSAVEPAAFSSKNPDKPLGPIRRLLAFLSPESSDIRIVFIFSVVVGILSLTTPLAVEAVVNTIAFGRYLQPLIILSLIVFVFLAFRGGLGVLLTVVVEIIQRRLFARVVDDVAFRLTRVPYLYLKKNNGPELVNRFFDIVNVQKITSKLLLETTMLVLQTIIGLTVLAFYHPFLLGYDLALIVIMVLALLMVGRGAVATAKKESKQKYQTAAWLQEIVRHPTTFKFNGGASFAMARADELAADYIHSRRDHFKILIRQVALSFAMQAIAATVLLGLGGYLVIDGQMTLGQLVAAELIVTVILGSFAKLGKDLESFYDLLASIDKLGALFDLPMEGTDKLQIAPVAGPSELSLVGIQACPNQQPLECTLRPGSLNVIYGGSGSGKSRLIETLAGQRPPLSGHCLINDYRVDLIGPESLQAKLGFLTDVEIFRGTVEENLRMGRHEVGSHEINNIVEQLGLQETITSLPHGFETELAVHGAPLSTGQSVRLVVGAGVDFPTGNLAD